jgi:hypothetical protein
LTHASSPCRTLKKKIGMATDQVEGPPLAMGMRKSGWSGFPARGKINSGFLRA